MYPIGQNLVIWLLPAEREAEKGNLYPQWLRVQGKWTTEGSVTKKGGLDPARLSILSILSLFNGRENRGSCREGRSFSKSHTFCKCEGWDLSPTRLLKPALLPLPSNLTVWNKVRRGGSIIGGMKGHVHRGLVTGLWMESGFESCSVIRSLIQQFANGLISGPLYTLKNDRCQNEDAKGIFFMWVMSTDVYYIRH